MSTNKDAKQRLIELFGPECFIEKLHLRKDTERHYTATNQYRRMKQLTFHHIQERCRGGKATVENGALLSAENHQWFNKQSKENQARMNMMFQEYKRCKLELMDDDEIQVAISCLEMQLNNNTLEIKPLGVICKTNRRIKKETKKQVRQQMQKIRKEWEDR